MADSHSVHRYPTLDPCVHCGFCLPACPTYLATGDENDSPRGRIVLMRSLESGDLEASDEVVRLHLDRCLGCRACEPACPSGVGYGAALESARANLLAANGLQARVRFGLSVFRRPARWKTVFGLARLLRATGLPARLSGRGRLGFAMGMLSASRPRNGARGAATQSRGTGRGTVALFAGCVMDILFRHVHAATKRVLEVNGFTVVPVTGQQCCGAPLLHAGDRHGAMDLLSRAVGQFGTVDHVVVNSAGCGAILKDAGHLLGTPEARVFSGRVRDVAQVLAEAGPVEGAALQLEAVYDPPCHLQHAQGVHQEVLQVLGAIPGLGTRVLPGAGQCCGSAGIFNLQHPGLAGTVLETKIAEIAAAEPRPAVVLSGNPGCIMQIGAGVRAAGLVIEVLHPVELLDRSYRSAGFYD